MEREHRSSGGRGFHPPKMIATQKLGCAHIPSFGPRLLQWIMAPLLPPSLYCASLPLAAAVASQQREAPVVPSVAEGSLTQRFLMGNGVGVPAPSEKKIAMYSKVG